MRSLFISVDSTYSNSRTLRLRRWRTRRVAAVRLWMQHLGAQKSLPVICIYAIENRYMNSRFSSASAYGYFW